VCPNCKELLPTRHWSVQRHIRRKHADIGEPISINTHKTRAQIGMEQGSSNARFIPGSTEQLGTRVDNPLGNSNEITANFVGYNTDCIHLRTPAIQSPQQPEVLNKQGDTLVSKFEEIRRLLLEYFDPYFVDTVIMKWNLHVLNDKSRESLLDEILRSLRYNANSMCKLTETLPQHFDSTGSSFSAMIPLHGHSVEHLTPVAVRKLGMLERMLKPFAHPDRIWEIIEGLIVAFNMTRKYSILNVAIEEYRIQIQKYGERANI
jgi:hypothetical protein